MNSTDLTKYDIPFSVLSKTAKEKLLEFYWDEIEPQSSRKQLRELQDERSRIEADQEQTIDKIRQWVYSTNGSFIEEIHYIFDHIHLDGEQKRIKQDSVRAIYQDVQMVVNRIFGGTYNTTYKKKPSVSADVKDYQKLYELTCEFQKATNNENSNLQNRLDYAFRLHVEYKRYIAELEQISIMVGKLKSGQQLVTSDKFNGDRAEHLRKIKKAVKEYWENNFGEGDCDATKARKIISELDDKYNLKSFWKDPERSIKGIINEY